MPKQIDAVVVQIDGCSHEGWTHYEIESNLMIPADAWSVTLAQPTIDLPPQIQVGADVKVLMSRQVVLNGKLDELELSVAPGQHNLHLSGRDDAGVLLDCSAPIFSRENVSLEALVASIVRVYGLRHFRIDADKTLVREKFSIEPGDTAWDSLRRAAEANGLWPWFEPDGTLVLGGPRYDLSPVATLTLRVDGHGNNVLNLRKHQSQVGRYSEITVYGQSHARGSGAGERDGRNNIKETVRDTGVLGYRPKIVFDHEAINSDIAQAFGLKLISDARVKSYTLTATVLGHRTDGGVLWTPGQRVFVKSDPHKIDGVYFLMARRFTGDKANGQRTQLTLKEDRMWVTEAHPSTRRHRRGKNSLPGGIAK